MSVLCTFPGRFGDLLWALPSVRALSRRLQQRIDLLIAGEFASLIPLLKCQPYLGTVGADPLWTVHPDHREPPLASRAYDQIFHLGYRGWPQHPLPFETLDCLNEEASKRPWMYAFPDDYAGLRWSPIPQGELDLHTPWITIEGAGPPCEVVVGFTEAWFELKLGLMNCLQRSIFAYGPPAILLTPQGSRWTQEGRGVPGLATNDWLETARAIRNSDLFFGDCSALHVLAVALGKPVILCEPMEARWNPIFYPLGMDGPQVTVVKGNDGRPTFDARHCAYAIARHFKLQRSTT